MRKLSNKQLAARIEPAIEMLLEARFLNGIARKNAAPEDASKEPSVQAYFNMRKVVAKMLGLPPGGLTFLCLALGDLRDRREAGIDDGRGGSDAEFLARRIRYWEKL